MSISTENHRLLWHKYGDCQLKQGVQLVRNLSRFCLKFIFETAQNATNFEFSKMPAAHSVS